MTKKQSDAKKEVKRQQTEAERMYRAGVKLVEIAEKLNRPAGTIRRWKKELNWDGEPPNVRGKNSERSEKKEKAPEPEEKEWVEKELEKGALDERRMKFCMYYARVFNATDAYQWAYGCSREAAGVSGCRLLKDPKIRQKIKELKTGELTKAMVEKEDIVEKYIHAAFFDIGTYVDGIEDGSIKFRDLKEVDTSLIQEIKNTKYGMSIKLVSKENALKWLADHWGIMTEEQQARVELIRKQAGDGMDDETETGVIMLEEVKEDEEPESDMEAADKAGGLAGEAGI